MVIDSPLRRTRQRAAVTSVLSGVDEFRTAQQVHEALKVQGDAVGLTTVYRTLQTMADAGDLDVIRTPEGEGAYRRCSRGHHHHLVCRSCGRTVEISGEGVEQWAAAMAAEHGFSQLHHEWEIFGLCSACRQTDAS